MRIDQLPLTHPQLGTWPTPQACALTGNRTSDPSQAGAQSTEPHQSEPKIKILKTISIYFIYFHPFSFLKKMN